MMKLVSLRRPVCMRGLSTAAAKLMPLETSVGANGVMTITFANERKLNAWTQPMMEGFFDCLQEAERRSDVGGVVVTGQGKYYSAGVDLSNVMKPMLPSKLVAYLRDSNQKVFQTVIDFPKPIVAAVNGPALGAAVTTATLMDSIVASEAATFSLPFAKLGVPPEGCSSALFVEHMGETTAQRILGPEAWVPTAAQAKEVGFPTLAEVVPGGNAECAARAVEVCTAHIAAGGGRRFDAKEAARLRLINARESADLGNAFVSAKFLSAMYDFNTKRKKTQLAAFFWLARATLPLWKPADVTPNPTR